MSPFLSETCECLWKQGFRNVKNIEGGYTAWVENGLAVKKSQAQDELWCALFSGSFLSRESSYR